MLESVYRHMKQSTVVLPVQVRSTGFYRTWSGWHDLVRIKHFLEIFWCVSGEVHFRQSDGRTFTLKPLQCCCYFPGDWHRISTDKNAEFCWVTFDGDQCSRLIQDFNLTREPRTVGECPQELFTRLRLQLHKPGQNSEVQAGIIGYELLSRVAYPDCGERFSLAEHFFEIIAAEYGDPLLSVDGIADKLNVHRSTLVRNIFAACGQTPQEYLVQYRMQRALSLLQNPKLSIKEIAQQTGFASANYFGKVFARTFGKTPSDMRNTL